MNDILSTALTRPIVTNAMRIALVVGSVLNLINQGEALLSQSEISWPHVVLNFIVPYCVASYSAAKNQVNNGEKEAACKQSK
ncbi:MAG: nitrate/nitrite transporter NrtS [Azonexaceae bacterium]|nr:nitrate/nitrite transporter NrtS [Azonexaceae bacterium]